MAITRAENQVLWGAAASVSVTTASTQTSDVMTLDATCIAAQITLKADNSGTPVAADKIYFWILQSSGDPDGAAVADEYDTPKHAVLLGVVDTFQADPSIMTAPLPIPQKGFKIYAEGVTSTTTKAITVSAIITEQRAA